MTSDRLREALELLAWSEALDSVRITFDDFLDHVREEDNVEERLELTSSY